LLSLRSLPAIVLGALLATTALMPAQAAPAAYAPRASKKMVKLPLMPGVLVGNINPYVVQRGDTLAWIAARFGVHPLHVTKPSAKELRNGMRRGTKIWIDQRRVQPGQQPQHPAYENTAGQQRVAAFDIQLGRRAVLDPDGAPLAGAD